MRSRRRALTALIGVAVLVAVLLPAQAAPAAEAQTITATTKGALPYLNPALPVEQRVADLLSRMTLEEKIGQMTQAERGAVFDNPSLIKEWNLGSVLSGGGSTPPTNTPAAWVEMVNRFQAQALSTRLGIPMIYGIDAVHGHGGEGLDRGLAPQPVV